MTYSNSPRKAMLVVKTEGDGSIDRETFATEAYKSHSKLDAIEAGLHRHLRGSCVGLRHGVIQGKCKLILSGILPWSYLPDSNPGSAMSPATWH